MSAGDIDRLLEIWASSLAPYGAEPPFRNHTDLYNAIDSTALGDTPWQSFNIRFSPNEALRNGNKASWMVATHECWFRDHQQLIANILSNPDFKDEFDSAPFHEYDEDGNHHFHNFMSGDWA